METKYLKKLNDDDSVLYYVKCIGYKSISIYPIGSTINRFTTFDVEYFYESGCIESTEAEFMQAQLDMINHIIAPL